MSAIAQSVSSQERQSTSPRTAGDNFAGNRAARKKRVRHFTADDRAAHREFEKSRREAFREHLTELASLLPALSDTDPQKLSKHVVVSESILYLKLQNSRLRNKALQLQAVVDERDELLAEVNQWRNRCGLSARQPRAIKSDHVQELDAEQNGKDISMETARAIKGSPNASQPEAFSNTNSNDFQGGADPADTWGDSGSSSLLLQQSPTAPDIDGHMSALACGSVQSMAHLEPCLATDDFALSGLDSEMLFQTLESSHFREWEVVQGLEPANFLGSPLPFQDYVPPP